jgi:aquaporin Z
VVTVPGPEGAPGALVAELVISLLLMFMVLCVTNTPRLARFTGLFAGCLVALFIIVEAPFSGMSMNPARTFASALPGGIFTALWVYLIAPPVGMLAAAQVYLILLGRRRVHCAKYHHDNAKRCIFCEYQHAADQTQNP